VAVNERNRAGGTAGGTTQGNGTGRRPANVAMLWYLEENGELAVTRVRTGLTDGQRTQIEADQLTEGTQVIVGVTQAAQTSTTSPFQATTPMGPGGPPF
jgi:hypothetical protein